MLLLNSCNTISASDYVEFSNFMSIDARYHRHCGHLKQFHVESDRKFFRVTFRSNDRLDGAGFNASYVFLDKIQSYRPAGSYAATIRIGGEINRGDIEGGIE